MNRAAAPHAATGWIGRAGTFLAGRMLVWAFGPTAGSPLRSVLARLARRLLRADRDLGLRRGVSAEVRMANLDFRWRPARAIPDRNLGAFPAHRRHEFRGGHLRLCGLTIHERAPRPPADRPPDPEVDEQLQIVTEPYILWDAPKPRFELTGDYYYDFGEEIPRGGMPPYTGPIAVAKPVVAGLREAFGDLRFNRRCFRLPPDRVITRRSHRMHP